MALRRFYNLEKRIQKDKVLAKEYKKCIDEYISLGHMQPCSDHPVQQDCYYLPHHAVFKESTTTKLRVVFDASATTTNGLSLNDQLHSGPILQRDIFSIILQWRKYKYAMTADIEKMYRMINMHHDDQNYQRILWRNNPSDPIQEYKLTTVTFGTKSAPYLAIRTLHQLADDEKVNYPIASNIIKNQFYVDDALLGAHTLPEAHTIQKQIIQMLLSAGFNLRKWVSNNPDLLKDIPDSMREVNLPLTIANEQSIKALGILWYPAADYFTMQYREIQDRLPTKRNILSDIAKLYDPLGWISPIIVTAKILMQQLWLSGCSWDDPISPQINQQWQNFKSELHHIDQIKIPRWIHMNNSLSNCQLHGFSDASMQAYSAAIYIRVITPDNNVQVNLLTAKSKIAPIKSTSLPRLELCGALLLARLIKRVKSDLNIQNIPIHAWTDSTITLAWVKNHPNKYKTYIANRVAEIQEIIQPESWHHVPTKCNPADCNSRGIKASDLINHSLWWHGPIWLKESENSWPQNTPATTHCQKYLEKKNV